MTRKYPSVLLENAVNEFSRLPGIGRRTALRLALHLLKRSPEEVQSFGQAMIELRSAIRYCKLCRNVCDDDICEICADKERDRSLICVVENIKEVMAIENTKQYFGLYHVLGGLISPMDGVGPSDLEIESLVQRVKSNDIKEIIFALSATMEGDTTNFYLYRKLSDTKVKISLIARGVSVGDEIEYADEVTLGSSIINRTPFCVSLKV